MQTKNPTLFKSIIKKAIQGVPVLSPESTIFDAKKLLAEKISALETINYFYVIDGEGKLIGVFSIREIYRYPDDVKVGTIMQKNFFKVLSDQHQEEAAILALKHNLKAIPVVDAHNRFMGVIPSDVILHILHAEHVEDFLRSVGIFGQYMNLETGSSWVLAKARIPWLIFGLFGGISAASIISFFESSIESYFILAAFIPLIVYMADAVGSQTQTLFIRNLVFNAQINLKKYLLKELATGFLMASILSVLLFVLSMLLHNVPYFIGIILGTALFFTVLGSVVIGILVPGLIRKMQKDPAIGSGPLATIIRDIASLIIYFLVASALLRFFE